MLNTKNFSPRQLAGYTALFIALPTAIGIFFIHPLWWMSAVSFFVIWTGSYFLILFTLQQFIYRKIKLIYKFTYQTKASKEKNFITKISSLKKVLDEDVESWAEQKKKEIEVLQANEAYRKEFLQNLSHELKTPIFAIQGYVDTLLGGAMSNEELGIKFLNNTSKNVSRLVNLLSDLDEITKLESGEQILYKENFVIQDLIREVFDSLMVLASKRSIKLSIKKGCEFPITVFADKEK